MPNLTTNYSLNKPLVNNATDQDLWGGYLNDNMDTIDTQLLLCRDWKKRAITGTDSVVAGDRHKILLCDATTAAFTETLLLAATAGDGFEVTIVKTDASAHAVTLDGAGAETIAGAATFALSGQGDAATLVCDGVSNWNFKGNKTTPSAVPSASTTAQGIIEIATSAEVLAGSDAVRAVVPSALAALITATSSGKFNLPGGITVQWGHQTTASSPTVTFGTAFSSAAWVVLCTGTLSNAGVTHVTTKAAASFDTYTGNSSGATSQAFDWLAIGPT